MEQKPESRSRLFHGDRVLWIIIAILSIISILLVFSSTAKMAYDISSNDSPASFLATQLGFLGGSIIIMFALHRVSVNVWGRFSWWIWGICCAATLLTVLFGRSTNGAARWFNIGFINVQPSEFLKVALVLHLSAMLAKVKGSIKNLQLFPQKGLSKAQNKRIMREGFWPITAVIFSSIGSIILAHTSSAVLLFVVSLVILIVAGVRWREWGKIALIAAVAGSIYWVAGMGRSDTASNRLVTWYQTWTQDRSEVKVDFLTDTERSMVAIQNGRMLGTGAGQSTMRVEMIHPETDYAFAFFVEEYGFILSVLLLLLYLWIFYRAMWIYDRCSDYFRELLVINVAVLLLTQALLHVMVSVNFIPETGQTLPLISRGGSALFCTYMAFTLMLSISVKNDEAAKKKEASGRTKSGR